MLFPVCLAACLVLACLAYSTVRQDTAREEALLRRARDMYSVATIARAAAERRSRHRQGAAPVPSHR